jgi:hypothetical protein
MVNGWTAMHRSAPRVLGLPVQKLITASRYTSQGQEKPPRPAPASSRGSAVPARSGPDQSKWNIIVCIHDLAKYDGTATGTTGQQYQDALKTSYSGSVGTTINFTDPLNGSAIAIHFDSYEETIRDLHSQIISAATCGRRAASYEVKIVLVEA